MPEILINRFDGGISDDIRDTAVNQFSITKHFDIFTNPRRLTPIRDLENTINDGLSADGMKQYKLQRFQLGETVPKTYALGRKADSPLPKIFINNDISSNGNTWTIPSK